MLLNRWIPVQIAFLVKYLFAVIINLYTEQETTIRLENESSSCEKRDASSVIQRTTYSENLLKEALHAAHDGINKYEEIINNLRYADDTVSNTDGGVQTLIERVVIIHELYEDAK